MESLPLIQLIINERYQNKDTLMLSFLSESPPNFFQKAYLVLRSTVSFTISEQYLFYQFECVPSITQHKGIPISQSLLYQFNRSIFFIVRDTPASFGLLINPLPISRSSTYITQNIPVYTYLHSVNMPLQIQL